nr:hypothetical protein [Tanacetum cinerariifolium]
MEKICDVMGCEDAFKTRLAVYKFEGNALAWWKVYKQAKGGDAWLVTNALQTLLRQIREEIREEFRTGSGSSNAGGNPPPECLKREYHSIRQTSTETSMEFMQRFLRLAGFLETAAGTEEEQAKNFQWGLRRVRSAMIDGSGGLYNVSFVVRMVNASGGGGGRQTATIEARQRVNNLLLEFNKWVAFAENFQSDPKACSKCVTQLNEHFLEKVVLVGGGYTPSKADIIVFSTVHPYKVSKSTENFRTLKQAIDDFSTDATRFSLADAGDGHGWKRDNYEDYMFREALKSRFYDLQAVRDEYRVFCGLSGMNRDLLLWTRIVAPVCLHYSEYVWRKLLNKEGFVIKAG